jgi:hypothetical protein
VGVRASTEAATARVQHAFERYVVIDRSAPPNYSLYLTDPGLDRSRPLVRLYRGCDLIFVTCSLPRAIAVLRGHLTEHLSARPRPRRFLRLAQMTVLGPSGAVLLPRELRTVLPSLELRLRREGLRVLESDAVLVDADTSEVVVEPWRVVFHEGENAPGPRHEAEAAAPGRYGIIAWAFRDPPADRAFTKGQAVARAMAFAYRDERDAVSNLRPLADVLQDVDAVGLPPRGEVVGWLRELVRVGRERRARRS